jgi:hypothetical protein
VEANKSTSVGELLSRAEQIGVELVRLAGWRARRLSKAAMLVQAIRTAGVADEASLRQMAAKVTREATPYLDGLVARIVDGWLGAEVWAPGHHGAFGRADDPAGSAAYAERLSLALSVTDLSGITVLRVHDDPRATFGDASRPGEAEERAAELYAELDQIDERLLDVICLRDLGSPSGTLTVGGRTFQFSRSLAKDVAQAATAA